MVMNLEGHQFQTDDEPKRDVLNWQRSQDETFRAARISNLPRRWKKCLIVKGRYLQKE
jgi:hypothetical protein